MPHDKDRTVNLFSTSIGMAQNLPLFHWKRMGRLLGWMVAALVCAMPLVAAQAQSTIDQVAVYAGKDRAEKLLAGAKREKSLTLYTSNPDMSPLVAAFEKKYDIKVTTWRGSAENVVQRAVTEHRAGRFGVDVFELGGLEMEALTREKLLVPVTSPVLGDIMPQALLPHGAWVGTRLNIFAAARNTKIIPAADQPKTYADLTDPKFRGKLGIEATDADWFATVVTKMGEEKGLALFRRIVANNGISVRKGHTLLSNLVASGEIPLAMTVYSYKPDQLKASGAPIESFILQPAVAHVDGVGVAGHAPHPNAAVLFFEFMLTDGQKIMAERDFVPTNRKVKEVPESLHLIVTDSAQMLDEADKWEKLYKEIFLTQPL